MQNLAGQSTNPSENISSSINDPDDAFEAYMQSLDETTNTAQEISVSDQLSDLSRKPRLILQNETILEWWFKAKSTQPDLYSLASAFLAIPCTQVSVERSFSVLGLILTKQRGLLKEETLQNILFVRLNSELLNKVDFSKT